MVKMRHVEIRTRAIPCLVLATALLVTACTNSDEATMPGDPATTTTTIAATTTQLPTTTETPTTHEPANAEADAIIQAWIDGWLADDPDAVIALYTEDGIYADAAYPFEYDVDYLVRTHMGSTTYTVADRLNVTYSDTGATVDWLWEGTHNGREFSMNANTVFEIQDGKIVRSTDSYERCTAPWTSACNG